MLIAYKVYNQLDEAQHTVGYFLSRESAEDAKQQCIRREAEYGLPADVRIIEIEINS